MNANMLESNEGFRDRWPFAARYTGVNGWRMHYVDEDAGDPIQLLHGNPNWGFPYRDVISPLVNAGHRVVLPDMIGFGLSEKPARELAHSLGGHIANLTRPGPPARFATPDGGLSRLERSNRTGLSNEQSTPGAR